MPIYRKIDKKFFKKWSSDMAYILGFMFADGNIVKTKRGTHFFAIYSQDKKLLSEMLKLMKSDHKLSKRPGEDCYRLQIGSKEMFEDLISLGLTPNKSKRMKLPIISLKYESDFIRGFFDGDGNVWSGRIHNDREKQNSVIQVNFTSASFVFLRKIQELLNNKGCGMGSLRKVGNYARLGYGSKDALKIYKIMYNSPHKLFLKRKKLVFEKFINTQV